MASILLSAAGASLGGSSVFGMAFAGAVGGALGG